jgi:hypothetical protein
MEWRRFSSGRIGGECRVSYSARRSFRARASASRFVSLCSATISVSNVVHTTPPAAAARPPITMYWTPWR